MNPEQLVDKQAALINRFGWQPFKRLADSDLDAFIEMLLVLENVNPNYFERVIWDDPLANLTPHARFMQANATARVETQFPSSELKRRVYAR